MNNLISEIDKVYTDISTNSEILKVLVGLIVGEYDNSSNQMIDRDFYIIEEVQSPMGETKVFAMGFVTSDNEYKPLGFKFTKEESIVCVEYNKEKSDPIVLAAVALRRLAMSSVTTQIVFKEDFESDEVDEYISLTTDPCNMLSIIN